MSTAMISKAPLRQVKDVRELLSNENARNQLASVASKHMNPERMMRVVANAIRTTPLLQQADPLSMLGALMNCAALGLEPNTPLGHAYLIPFKNNKKGIVEVQVVIGYKGYLDLARRSGMLISVHADVVYQNEIESGNFTQSYGSNQHLHHVYGARSGPKAGAYCHFKVKSGDLTGEGHIYMTADEIIAVRDASQSWLTAKRFGKTAESPWATHEDRMWRKTAIRRAASGGELPMSIEFVEAMEIDDNRVDYAAYAMNPSDGVVIEGEAAEGAEESEAQEPEKAAPKAVEKPKPQTKVETRNVQEAQVVAEQQAPQASATKQDPAKTDAPVRSRHDAAYDKILNSAIDANNVDAALTYFSAEIDAMQKEAPETYSRLMEELDAFANGGDEEQGRMNV